MNKEPVRLKQIIGQEERIYQYVSYTPIGTGGFAAVYPAIRINDRLPVAIKQIDIRKMIGQNLKQRLRSEVQLHLGVKHSNIVECFDASCDDDYAYLVMEMCEGLTLRQYIEWNKALPENVARLFMDQILSAVECLHRNNIIHRDLSWSNILLTKDFKTSKDLKVKVGDFGLATQLKFEGQTKNTLCGTPDFIAPEVIHRNYSFEADIYSLGSLLYAMLVGKPPKEKKRNDYEGLEKRVEYEGMENLSTEARGLIRECLKDSTERIKLQDIRTHPFMTKGMSTAYPYDKDYDSIDSGRDTLTTISSSNTNPYSSASPASCAPVLGTVEEWQEERSSTKSSAAYYHTSSPMHSMVGNYTPGSMGQPSDMRNGYYDPQSLPTNSQNAHSHSQSAHSHISLYKEHISSQVHSNHANVKTTEAYHYHQPYSRHQQYQPAPTPSHQQYQPAPTPSHQQYQPAPNPSHQQYDPAPSSSHKQYQPAPSSHQQYQLALTPSLQQFQPASSPSLQHYQPAPNSSLQQYQPAPTPSHQQYQPAAPSASQQGVPYQNHNGTHVSRHDMHLDQQPVAYSNKDYHPSVYRSFTSQQLVAPVEPAPHERKARRCASVPAPPHMDESSSSRGSDSSSVRSRNNQILLAVMRDKELDGSLEHDLKSMGLNSSLGATSGRATPVSESGFKGSSGNHVSQHSNGVVRDQRGLTKAQSMEQLNRYGAANKLVDIDFEGHQPMEHKQQVYNKRLPEAIRTDRLKPIRRVNINCIMHILENHWVCVEFKRSRTGREERVYEVFQISPDGLLIEIYHPNGSRGVAVQEHPPPPSVKTQIKQYRMHELPDKYWKKYNLATKFVDLVKSRTPKVILYTDQAKCMLMENQPDHDLEIKFYTGNTSIVQSKDGTRVTEADGTSRTLDRSPEGHSLSPETRRLLDYVQKCRQLCLIIERNVEKTLTDFMAVDPINIIGARGFPTVYGQRPKKLAESQSPSRVPTTTNCQSVSPSLEEMRSLDGTTVSQFTSGSSTAVRHPSSLSSRPNTKPPLPGRATPVAGSRPPAHPEPLLQVTVPSIGQGKQFSNGDVEVQCIDGSYLFFVIDTAELIIHENSITRRYKGKCEESTFPKEDQRHVSNLNQIIEELKKKKKKENHF